MHGFPGFPGKLGNYHDTSPCCMTVHYWITGVITSTCSLVRSRKPCCMSSVRLESQEWHWRTDNWWQYNMSIQQGRVCMVQQVHMYEFLLFEFVPHIHFRKAYHHCGLASYISTWCSCTHCTYLDGLYGECSRSTCACANSGYQVLLSDFVERLGMRLEISQLEPELF